MKATDNMSISESENDQTIGDDYNRAREYFKERGIDIDKCEFTFAVLSAEQTHRLTGWRVPSIRFIYYDCDGNPLPFIRLRFMDVGGPSQPTHRYWQQGSGAHLYIPWMATAGDAECWERIDPEGHPPTAHEF